MEKRQLRIDVLGASFVIQSEETPSISPACPPMSSPGSKTSGNATLSRNLSPSRCLPLSTSRMKCSRSVRAGAGTGTDEIESVAESLISRIDDELLTHTPLPDGEDPPLQK